jgi:hypothetical protein
MARLCGIRHREERSDAAIQRSKGALRSLDRFAALAMTDTVSSNRRVQPNVVCKIEGSEPLVNWLGSGGEGSGLRVTQAFSKA